MIYAFYVLHVVISLFLILVVLLQQGKGADLSVFGGGGTMTAFGARGAATLLHKLTVWGFVGFIITTMAIGILQGQRQGSTVMSDLEAPAATAPADEEATDSEAAEASGPLEGALAEEDEPAASDATEPAASGDAGDDGAATDAPAGTDGAADEGDAATSDDSGQ